MLDGKRWQTCSNGAMHDRHGGFRAAPHRHPRARLDCLAPPRLPPPRAMAHPTRPALHAPRHRRHVSSSLHLHPPHHRSQSIPRRPSHLYRLHDAQQSAYTGSSSTVSVASQGPTSWSLSKITFIPTDVAGMRPRVIDDAHRKYGDVVRTGPRELSINATTAVTAIMGVKSSFWRGPWYVSTAGSRSPHIPRNLHSAVIESNHSARRKIWDAAFSAKALKGYESILVDNMDLMVNQLEARAQRGERVNIDDYCSFYSFDVMSQAGFGGDFGLLQKGQLSPMIQALEDFMQFVQLVGNVPYLIDILGAMPNPIAEFDKYMAKIVSERKARNEAVPDIMSHLLHEVETKGSTDRMDKEATADARLIVVAGSDTSSTTMGIATFFLMENPSILARLRQELLDVFGDDPSLLTDFTRLDDKTCPLLNAVINEALRIYPPVQAGLQRQSRQANVVDVNGTPTVIPANTIVTLPIWSIQRDPRNFAPHPLKFRPDRWLKPEHEERFNKAAFMPFSYGKTSCVGKVLAYMELRLVIANLVRRFDFVPTQAYNAAKFEAGLVDAFVTRRIHKLPVTVQVRTAVA
ncbi:hypothetical protein L1887_59055 [Cichorium endivia]|nr:hypothetical protein L1887_59055 [Cichorium endivia]